MGNWGARFRDWKRSKSGHAGPVIGVALGGGFARGIAHMGVLRVLEQNKVPVGAIAGVSAGAIAAAAYASGTEIQQIVRIASAMRFNDIARWNLSAIGLAGSEKMESFLCRLLRTCRFEEMKIPLAVLATDLAGGRAVVFRDHGDVMLPIRASCSYPGLFQPVRHNGAYLVDGAMTMEVPAEAVRRLGATHVLSVCLAVGGQEVDPRNMFQVVSRSFQIMHTRTEHQWRRHSTLVIEPDARGVGWDRFDAADRLIEAGERAALAALPRIKAWLAPAEAAEADRAAPADPLGEAA
ncbi:MAG TPA: patatin-like phospholipase family protein [Bryobacteraceae bacterium]|nr:patatin-like phospholipase family protein [Bryobacteraceae bacterium]